MFRDDHGRVQRVAAYAVCENARREMLLCRLNDRTTSPGTWTLPGGGIHFGEHPDDAIVRECEEETGLVIEVRQLLGVDSLARTVRRIEDDQPYSYHAVRLLYRVEVVGGVLRHEVDNSTDMAAWHSAESLAAIPRTDVAVLGRSFTTI